MIKIIMIKLKRFLSRNNKEKVQNYKVINQNYHFKRVISRYQVDRIYSNLTLQMLVAL